MSSLFACGMYELLSNHELTPRGWVTMTQQSDQFKSDPTTEISMIARDIQNNPSEFELLLDALYPSKVYKLFQLHCYKLLRCMTINFLKN